MARLARAAAAEVPHHMTQRGNRRQSTFFGDADYELYRTMLAVSCARHGVAVWAYCLMPNHVHLVLVPTEAAGLRLALGETHQRYTLAINRRQGWIGHLWQGRFASCALDAPHLVAAVRYVELNPVRARLVERTLGVSDPIFSAADAQGPLRIRTPRLAPMMPERQTSSHTPTATSAAVHTRSRLTQPLRSTPTPTQS